MPNPAFAATASLMLLATPAGVPGPVAPRWMAPVAGFQHISIHVPRVTIMSSTTIITTETLRRPLREKKAEKCVKTKKMVGFSVPATGSVDFMFQDGKWVRAKLDADCPALGFYSGLYIKPNPDGKMCIVRDVLRSRSGSACKIQELRTLVPVK